MEYKDVELGKGPASNPEKDIIFQLLELSLNSDLQPDVSDQSPQAINIRKRLLDEEGIKTYVRKNIIAGSKHHEFAEEAFAMIEGYNPNLAEELRTELLQAQQDQKANLAKPEAVVIEKK